MRTLDEAIFHKHGLVSAWVQENEACSTRAHIIRGLHFQRPPATETKLVRVIVGKAFDVFVDLRRRSATFGRWGAVELCAERQNMVYIPKGFAHGYCTLTDRVVMLLRWILPLRARVGRRIALERSVDWNRVACGRAHDLTEGSRTAAV